MDLTPGPLRGMLGADRLMGGIQQWIPRLPLAAFGTEQGNLWVYLLRFEPASSNKRPRRQSGHTASRRQTRAARQDAVPKQRTQNASLVSTTMNPSRSKDHNRNRSDSNAWRDVRQLTQKKDDWNPKKGPCLLAFSKWMKELEIWRLQVGLQCFSTHLFVARLRRNWKGRISRRWIRLTKQTS